MGNNKTNRDCALPVLQLLKSLLVGTLVPRGPPSPLDACSGAAYTQCKYVPHNNWADYLFAAQLLSPIHNSSLLFTTPQPWPLKHPSRVMLCSYAGYNLSAPRLPKGFAFSSTLRSVSYPVGTILTDGAVTEF